MQEAKEVVLMEKDPSIIEAERILADVVPEHEFRLSDGKSIKNLKELYSAIQGIDDSTFVHHVNGERNDFGNWVKDIHKDYALANSLFSSKSKDECVKAVSSRIYELEKTKKSKESLALLTFSASELSESAELEKMVSVPVSIKTETVEKGDNLTANAILCEQISKFNNMTDETAVSEEVSSAEQVLGEIAALFSKESFSSVVSEIKDIFSYKTDLIEEPVVKQDSDDKKERMLSHLKKVYK